jgi:hypothetical protein
MPPCAGRANTRASHFHLRIAPKSDNRPRVAGARALVGLKFRRALALFRETQLAGKGFLRQSQVNESNGREIRAPASQPGIFLEHLSSYYVAAV